MGPLILRKHQWRVRYEVLRGPVADQAELRKLSAIDDPRVPDDLLLATAMTAATVSAAFIEIMDGGCFTAAPCLCCYSVRSAEYMREAASALRLFCSYHDPASFVAHRAYGRAVLAAARDLLPAEVARIRKWMSRLQNAPEGLRKFHRLEKNICVAIPACRPGTLWVYSTPDGRRLLRHLARALPRELGALSVSVASSDANTFPRFRLRMYAANLCGGEGQGTAQDVLLSSALAWAEKRKKARLTSREGATNPGPLARKLP